MAGVRSLPDRPCQACGTLFRPRQATARFCSRPCLWSQNGGRNRKPESWWVNARGYISGRVWENGKRRSVRAHRYVVEQLIGRKLNADEDVHHKNGNKQDNRPENLELLTHGAHSKLTSLTRTYPRGYKLQLSDEERAARAAHMRRIHANRVLARAARLECPR